MKRKLIIVAIIVAVIALVVFGVYKIQSNQANQASAFQTAVVEKGEIIGLVGATGTVHANQSALLTWQTGGTVAAVNVKAGDKVKAGDILASLKKTTLSQSIILAEADLVSAQRALEDLQKSNLAAANAQLALVNAQDTYEDRLQEREALNYQISYSTMKMTATGPKVIKTKRDATEKEIYEADAKLAVATAEMEDAGREWERLKGGPDARDIAAAEARVAAAQATINLQYITAPFDGTITDIPVKVGDVVAAGTSGFRLDDFSHLLVEVQVSEIDVNQVRPGQNATLTFDAILSKEYHGVVTEVARVGTSDSGVVNFAVTVEINDTDEQVLPQMTAAVNIVVIHLNDVILIPNRAVRLVDGQRVVYLLKNGEAAKTNIEIGASSDLMSELKAGEIKAGDVIILNPPTSFFMGPGSGMPMGR
ncbi:MAG: hypothetical protein C0391_08900 [Anaerolinea sp.]|nr:hypothetical protein [Anaerolinea sp.]